MLQQQPVALVGERLLLGRQLLARRVRGRVQGGDQGRETPIFHGDFGDGFGHIPVYRLNANPIGCSLAESAERRRDIDTERAKAAVERAQKRMEKGTDDIDFARAKAALERALHRIRLAETRQ